MIKEVRAHVSHTPSSYSLTFVSQVTMPHVSHNPPWSLHQTPMVEEGRGRAPNRWPNIL